jgi:rhodanese-related sulfurtransferase
MGYGEHELPADKQAPLVFYCSGAMCRKAPRAARRATQLGYADVAVMSAGIGGWMAGTLPTESVDG